MNIGDLFFRPSSLSVSLGTTVTWSNGGDFVHTTTAGTAGTQSGEWHSGSVAPGESFSVTFETAGTFQYFCSIHPNDMRATIVVTDA